MANLATIVEQAFNVEVPIQLPPVPPPDLVCIELSTTGTTATMVTTSKTIGPSRTRLRNLYKKGYLAQFVKKPYNNQAEG